MLERALSYSHLQKWPSHLHTYTSMLGQVQSESKAEKVVRQDMETLRERVQGQASWEGEGANCRRNHEATSAEVMVWAPKLAIFRAVDAVLGGEGRPRITFMRSEADSVASESR